MNHNGKNERIKRRYARYLKDAKRKSETTIDAALGAIDRFEGYMKQRDFAKFHIEQAIGFKDHLAIQRNERTGATLSKATLLHTLADLRAFFIWLADQPGYQRRIRYSDADYFSLSLKDTAIAKAENDAEGPTLEQVRHVLATMLAGTDIEKRNRALIAFTLLTGIRDDAIASMRLKHIDLKEGRVTQDAREVRTKASKTMVTFFFPVGDDIHEIVEDWLNFLVRERQWGLNDPLFPATRVKIGDSGGFAPARLERRGWTTSAPIRAIFRDAFNAAGLPYYNPHSFRKTLARHGLELCRSNEAMKAWSQNLGHEKMLTTLTSSGQIDVRRQGELLRKMGHPNQPSDPASLLAAVQELLGRSR